MGIYKCICLELYKNSKDTPHIVEHMIELNATIPLAHQMCYHMNLNYAIVVKQDLDKMLAIGFVKLVEQAT